jgi:hypothetical protein
MTIVGGQDVTPAARHPDESQDPEPSSAAFVTLGPDFRQDDGVGGEAFRF